ncbi:MAG: hypothetical protein M3N93_09675 [Acidobacteriota bacterium]|nr:hypothetical protein [Acidobacteriota bacterium]
MGRALGESLPVSLSNALDGPVLPASALRRTLATLGQRPAVAPGISTEHPEALLAGANRAITGYIERVGGAVRITASEEDLSKGKTLLTVSASGDTPYGAIVELARRFSPRAAPPITKHPEALRAYATALELPLAAAPDLLRQAISLDSDFGEAWVSLIGSDASHNDRDAVVRDIGSARRGKLDNVNRALVDLEAARLQGDGPAIIAAMRELATLVPADLSLMRSLAEIETRGGDFSGAASAWMKVTASSPDDPLVWNSLGYARAYAGDYRGAVAALREYDQLRPKEANPRDSLGDVNYFFRKFKEAAADYMEAYQRQPGFEQGGDLYKAAWAKFQAGYKKDADEIFAQFRAVRAKSNAGAVSLLAGDWLFRTGRASEAFALARTAASETQSAPLRADLNAQLAIWDLLGNDRAQAAKDSAAVGARITNPSVFLARFASLPSASAIEWEMRASSMFSPNLANLRELGLGYALVLDGKRAAALPVWERIAKNAGATDFFAVAVLTRLRGEELKHPLLPDPNNLNQFAGLLNKL